MYVRPITISIGGLQKSLPCMSDNIAAAVGPCRKSCGIFTAALAGWADSQTLAGSGDRWDSRLRDQRRGSVKYKRTWATRPVFLRLVFTCIHI